jgi:hypothetical protein
MSSPTPAPEPRRRHFPGRASTPKRTRSASYEPYYKVQVFDPRSCAWKPAPGMYGTEAEAWAAAPAGARLMHMTPDMKTPITR